MESILIGSDQVGANGDSFDVRKCDIHTSSNFEAFCTDHQQMCCIRCIMDTHR
ncbi:hypothetical protein DPMN_037673 [Dreissena polymorpha]|uniref:B box-type domain-containing protein n=1 Tax=Dreissena polymorpha TaxID=45954 RepID=A0A9D4MDZ5_DREPO|nr:hypothetical protein DPMN_037673 [Dreissena polymorpha]